MSTSINRVILCGRLGRDPEIRTLENGTKVGDFSLATGGEKFTTKEGKEVEIPTQWHNCVVWRGLADMAEKYLKKGHAVTVFGEISYRKFQDKDGQDRYTTDIIANDLFIGGAPTGGNPTKPANPADYAQPTQQSNIQSAPQVQAQPQAEAQPAPQTPEPPAQSQGGNDGLPF